MKLKQDASKQKSVSANVVVGTGILEVDPLEHLPNPANLTKIINRKRLKERQQERRQLSDPISLSNVHIPLDFLISFIRMEDQEGNLVARHIHTYVAEQISFLRNAATWYLDGTFKAARYPLVQLFEIQ